MDDAKVKVVETARLPPANEELLRVTALGVPPRLKDHMRCLLTDKIKCGSFWNK